MLVPPDDKGIYKDEWGAGAGRKVHVTEKIDIPEIRSILGMLPEDQKTEILSTIIEAILKKSKDESASA